MRRLGAVDERSGMTTTPNEPVQDEDIETAGGPAGPAQMGLGDADGTDAAGGDADGTDADGTDSTDGDATDTTDGDSSDGGDADGTDA